MSKTVTIEITKLVNGGQGLGFYEGKPVFAFNSLPGETAIVELSTIKKNFLVGTAKQIINSSPHRITPKESHYLSCSPWQIMDFDYENEWKKKIAQETFKKIAGIELKNLEIDYNQQVFGYRNKIEYRFCRDKKEGAALAFYQRGTNNKSKIDGCALAKDNINKAARQILSQINKFKIDQRDLSSLTLRQDKSDQVVATLFITNKNLAYLPDVTNEIISGFNVYLQTASASKLLYSYGQNFLLEELASKKFMCDPLSFFQVNVKVFEKTLAKINSFIDGGDEIVDYYSGVGSIGVSLGDKVKSGVLVEENVESANLAIKNIHENGLENFRVYNASSQNLLNEIKKKKTIIFDPPRSGLHPSIVNKLLDTLPRKIIYLSCDIATQARDIKTLSLKYRVSFCKLYNFFPRTPHIECLVFLEKMIN